MPNKCPIPVRSELVSSAKLECRNEPNVLSLVPMIDYKTGAKSLHEIRICLSHSVEIAVWKLIESLPRGSM